MSGGNPIVTTDWLAARLDDPGIRVIEVWNRPEPVHGDEPRIPGAVRFFWKSLCWNATDRQFVTPQELAERLGPVGISEEHTIVLVGEPVQYGTYAYWALAMAGHGEVRILDGARKRWLAEGRPLARERAERAPVTYRPGKANPASRVGRDDVLAHLGDPGRLLLDVRTPEEFSGERVIEYGQFDHGAERAGRIPGARHFFFRQFLNDDDTFRSRAQIEAALRAAGIEPAAAREIVCYCRLSHRATLAWTALTHILGLRNVRIYDGSWTEWGSMVGMPVEHPDPQRSLHVG